MKLTAILKKDRHLRRSVFTFWMLSYILLLFLFFLITSIVYIEGENIIGEEINNLNESLLTQIQIAIDSELQSIKKTSYQVGMNSNFRMLTNENFSYEDLDRYKLLELYKDLTDIQLGIDYAIDLFIYLKNIDMIFTKDGMKEARDFYESISMGVINFNDMSFTQWYKMLQAEHKGEYIPICYIYEGHDIRQRILYIQSVPITNTSLVNANIVITLNNNKFQKMLQSIHSINNVHAFILDKKSRVLFSTNGTYDSVSPVGYNELTRKTGLLHATIGGVDMVVSHINSSVSDWKYVSIVPSGTFWEKVKYIRMVSTVCVVLCIIIGGIAAFFFTRRNYSPINSLVQLLRKRTKINAQTLKGYNEYNFLQDAMGSILNENESIKQTLRLQNVTLRSNFLTKILKGTGIEDREFIRNALVSYDIRFTSDHFAVMLFYIVDFNKLFNDEDREKSQEKLKLVQFIITNIVEEMVSRKNTGYMTEVNEMLACIINFRKNGTEEGIRYMLKTAHEATKFIWNNFKIDFMVSVSGIHQTLYGIPQAYAEALNVMEYKVAMEDRKLICHDEIKTGSREYSYSIATEQHLINHVKTGDYNAVAGIIENVFEENFSKSSKSIALIKCLIFDLVSTIIKTMSEISSLDESPFMQELNIVDRLARCVKVDDMKHEILEMLKKICMHIQQNKKDRNDDLIDSVKWIVNNDYSDFNLTVASLAESIKLSPAYLSNVFREQTGEGLFEYISRIRMEKAKQLLTDQDMSVKDIALKVGYYNSSVFIRAFKKYEGITPGIFRRLQR